MDIANAHKSKTNLAITRIGTMVDMTNFSSLCINCNTIISAIVVAPDLNPLIVLKFVNLLNNPDFDAWYAATKGSMPSLHWHVYSFLERIFNLFAKFAMDFGNINVMTGSRPLSELNTKLLVKALTVLKAFKDQLTLAQSTNNSPIPILAATVSKFSTRRLGANSNAGTPAPVPVSASALPENTQNQCHDAKHHPSTPMRVQKQLPFSARRSPTAMVLPTQLSSALSQTWACSFSPNMMSRPQISSPRTCQPRSVPTSLVRVASAPGRTAHTATPGMLTN
jgi:hypothetical protein